MPELTYREFGRLVAKYPQEDLLREVARLAVEEAARRFRDEHLQPPLTPFALAGVARAALTQATDRRRNGRSARIVDEEVIRRLCSEHLDIYDPVLDDAGHADVKALLSRIMFEQLGVQYSPLENLARTATMLLDGAAAAGLPDAEDWRAPLGTDLASFVRTGFALWVAMISNAGSVSRSVLEMDHVRPIWGSVSPDELRAVMDQHFCRTPAEHRRAIIEAEFPGREKWSYNSLQAHPLVLLGDDVVGPAPHYLIDRVTPTGLFYIGIDTWGNDFAKALGAAFERHVAGQLGLLRDATVFEEASYIVPNRKVCDFVVITGQVAVLVEAKTARPSLDFRAGGSDGLADATVKLSGALAQIESTAELINARHPSFAFVPAGLPLVGLVVTLEPYHLRQSGHDDLLASNALPVSHAWSHELETTVACLASVGDTGARLLTALTPTSARPASLINARDGIEPSRNPIIDEAFNRVLSWPIERDPNAGAA